MHTGTLTTDHLHCIRTAHAVINWLSSQRTSGSLLLPPSPTLPSFACRQVSGLEEDKQALRRAAAAADRRADQAEAEAQEARRATPSAPPAAAIKGQTTDQADVRALRGLDRAHSAVVAEVHVSNLEAGPLT